MSRTRLSTLATVVLACVLAILPARAQTTAERLQRLLWTYGDTGDGWTGGDGTYSVELPDGRIVWLFSDTFLGEVNEEDGSRPRNAPFVHNSMVVQDGHQMTTLLPRGDRTLIEPTDGVGFYWVGDALVENGELLVFVMRFVAAPAPYAFQQVGTDVARFSLPSLVLEGIDPMPFAFTPGIGVAPVSYGAALMRHGGYDYIYGVEDIHLDKYLHVARVPAGFLMDEAWEYWTGSEWTPLSALSARVMDGVANELSIERVGQSFVLVTQDHAIGRDILVSTALAPEGAWGEPSSVFQTPEGDHLVTYNAKAHDQFSTDHTLVITYNVNAKVIGDLYSDVGNYRPRFIEVSLEPPPAASDMALTLAE